MGQLGLVHRVNPTHFVGSDSLPAPTACSTTPLDNMGKHSKRKRPGRTPGREQKKLAPSDPAKIKLASELTRFATAIVEFVKELH